MSIWEIDAGRMFFRTAMPHEADTIVSLNLSGGMTNRNVIVTTQANKYILRIPGEGTSDFINRNHEYHNTLLAEKIGLHPPVAYINPENGIKISYFIDHAKPLTNKSAATNRIILKIAKILKSLHTSCYPLKGTFHFETELARYQSLLNTPDGLLATYPEYALLLRILPSLTNRLDTLGRVTAPCHNDLVAANWLLHQSQLYLLDWEYAGMNDPAWDIASFFSECELSLDARSQFLQVYLTADENLSVWQEKIAIYEVTAHLLWFVWSVIKEQHGVSFGDYGLTRLHKAVSILKENVIHNVYE